ncbi:MAG: PEP/pyruvate-binding domain-containing protein [Pseudomonadota bacterium]
MPRAPATLLLALLTACPLGGGPDPIDPDPAVCAEAEARLGYPACVQRLDDEEAFTAVTVASSAVDELRAGKYLVPAGADARLPTLWLIVGTFPLHFDFLVTAFPDLFSGLSAAAYTDLILYRETREFFAGTHSLYLDADGFFYGFTVWDDPADASSTVLEGEVAEVWGALHERSMALGDLYWVPITRNQQEAAQGWGQTVFPIRGLEEVVYEVYNPGVGYGNLRLYTLSELASATAQAAYGYQDILVLEEAPSDLERVVSGIVTGTRQGALSHLNVRSLARGTPNCFIADPLAALAAWEGQLVRLECGEEDWSVAAATEAEAQAWWEELRPEPVEVCDPDLSEAALPGLLELDTSSAEARGAATCRFGAKGTNLAVLYQRIAEDYQLSGFLVPFSYYDAFMRASTWAVDLGTGEAEHSFADTLAAWHTDALFLSDAAVRRERLDDLRAAIQAAPHDPAFIAALAARIQAVWGDDTTMVRFRSSSNAEDAASFNGAGLYESASACLADSLDDDETGPSRCDPDKAGEESLEEALGQVWASLWNTSAWEERDWYGIDHDRVAMGILVDDRAKDEQANIVAFSGNPTSPGDDRTLVNAQIGAYDVVSSEPGVYPEASLLTLEGGYVTAILRVSESSEVEPGEYVLSDARLAELGSVLWDIAQVFPQDTEVPEGSEVLWDTEWKVWSDGRLIIKQIRPYLREVTP